MRMQINKIGYELIVVEAGYIVEAGDLYYSTFGYAGSIP